jgi:hypothetical protein
MTIDLRTHGMDLWTLGETTSEKNESREAKTFEARIPEVIDRLFRRTRGA